MALCCFICSHTVCFVCLPRIFQLLANSDKKCRQYYQQSTSAFLCTKTTRGERRPVLRDSPPLPCKDPGRPTRSTGENRCLEGALLPTVRGRPERISLLSWLVPAWKSKLRSSPSAPRSLSSPPPPPPQNSLEETEHSPAPHHPRGAPCWGAVRGGVVGSKGTPAWGRLRPAWKLWVELGLL